jgi:uncharacterized membrane protein (UPF0127 family)
MKTSHVIGSICIVAGLALLGKRVVLKSTQPHIIITDASGDARMVTVERAITPQQHAHGLMDRTTMPENHGMLFIFDKEQTRTFWMKNTPLPLDMIFINRDKKVVGIVENAEPQTLSPRAVAELSLYVLEVHGGWSKRNKVTPGCQVQFKDITITH